MAPIGLKPRRLCVAAAGSSTRAAEKVLATAADVAGLALLWEPGTLTATLAPTPITVDRFLLAIDTELCAHNATQDRLRLRVALHRGTPEEAHDLLTARPLTDSLDEAPDVNLAVLLSDRLPIAAPEFREVLLRDNPTTPRAWIWLPGWRADNTELPRWSADVWL
ncbi:hypothetical protein JOD54_000871 [Actinokineospora baliensis]|uniref:hypothetical protein n=1 Tax=Actinokineospora baliensis TaxID=547056 RepID=UPI00195C069C|nr:hypothetical protein [Actinokineospora baliensis]MBM7770667.1 hypothetical protein [Actinokineospora baliensis]